MAFAQNKYGVAIQYGNAMHDPRDVFTNFIPVNTADNTNQFVHQHYLGLGLNYAITDSITLRLRVGISHFDMRKELDEFGDSSHYISQFSGKQTNIHIAPGIVWNIGSAKLTPQAGFELLYTKYGNFNYKEDAVTNDSITEQVMVHKVTTTFIPGGFGIGGGAVFGFQYEPFNWLSIGAEFTPTLLYVSLKGDRIDEITYIVTSSPSQTDSKDENFHGSKGIEYANRFAFNISFWF